LDHRVLRTYEFLDTGIIKLYALFPILATLLEQCIVNKIPRKGILQIRCSSIHAWNVKGIDEERGLEQVYQAIISDISYKLLDGSLFINLA